MDLKQEFKNLEQRTHEEDSYRVISLDGYEHKIGKSSEGYPIFFIRTQDTSSSITDIVREKLSVRYNQFCRVETEDGHIEEKYAIIVLHSTDWALQSSFLDVVYLTIQNMRSVPTRKELAAQVENLITIFSALIAPPVKKAQGLWGELLVIEQSKNPQILINAWHSSPNAKYDFTVGRDKIEVKSTSSEERIHRFSLDQLNPSPNSRLLIASTIVRESSLAEDGLSIKGLFDKICSRLTDIDSKIRLYSITAKTLGTDFSKCESLFFDYTTAADLLKFYNVEDIPHILKEDIPELVSDVKFASNLSFLTDCRKKDIRPDYSDSELFKATL